MHRRGGRPGRAGDPDGPRCAPPPPFVTLGKGPGPAVRRPGLCGPNVVADRAGPALHSRRVKTLARINFSPRGSSSRLWDGSDTSRHFRRRGSLKSARAFREIAEPQPHPRPSRRNPRPHTRSRMSPNWSFETRQIHAGQTPDPTTKARALPIYQTTSYAFDSSEHGRKLFALEDLGNIYTRIITPPRTSWSSGSRPWRAGVGALLVASGQSAETLAILNLAQAGDQIVSSPRLYGGTYNLFHYTLPKFGISVDFVESPTTSTRGARRSSPTPRRCSPSRSPTRCSTFSTSKASPPSHTRPGSRSSSITPSPHRISSDRSSTAWTSSCTRRPSTSAVTAP